MKRISVPAAAEADAKARVERMWNKLPAHREFTIPHDERMACAAAFRAGYDYARKRLREEQRRRLRAVL